jgi:hypothetical protein
VPEYCTCGATLPEDALFCHKCGKRQRGEEFVAEEPAAPPPLPVPIALSTSAPQFPAIGFHNGPAVRIALLTGVLSVVLSTLLGELRVPGAFVPGLVAAGFLAVFLYRRRTGQRLSILHGAHLGWISGLFGFLITTVLLTLIVMALSDPAILAAMKEQLKASPAAPDVNQVIETLRSPSGIFIALIVSFTLFTVLPAFGGALGAKFLDRD